MNGEDLYAVYGSVTDFKNYQGLPLPKWEDLTETIQRAWNAVADARPPIEADLGTRDMRQIFHALAYEKEFQDAGIPGHNQFILIAKLARALGIK